MVKDGVPNNVKTSCRQVVKTALQNGVIQEDSYESFDYDEEEGEGYRVEFIGRNRKGKGQYSVFKVCFLCDLRSGWPTRETWRVERRITKDSNGNRTWNYEPG